MLNSNNHIPLYIQIAQQLSDLIKNGTYKPGDKLPSDNELTHQFGVSRITATAALDELVEMRLAYRERGRGTFVAKPLISDFPLYTSFTEDMIARGYQPSSVLVSFRISSPDPDTASKLKMPVGGEYYCLTRVRMANQEPVAYQQAYLPTALFPGISQDDFDQNYLYELMRKKFGLKPTWAEAVLEARGATPVEANALGLKSGQPALLIWHISLDEHFVPLEYVRSVYHSDRFSFSTGRNLLRS